MGTDDIEQLITIKQAAQKLSISESTVRVLIKQGILKRVQAANRSPRITERSVREHIEKQLNPKSDSTSNSNFSPTSSSTSGQRGPRLVEPKTDLRKTGGDK
jgi:excisionase family DNA binding protein